MKFLKNILSTNLKEGDDLDALTPDVMSEVQKNIRDGAKDIQQKWANSLELVHKAYDVASVHRPTPDLKAAWKQYEENLMYAVQQLAKFRGMEGDWRMSSSVFNESMIPPRVRKFRVHYNCPKHGHGTTIDAHHIDHIIGHLTKDCPYDFKVSKTNDHVRIDYSKWGIKHGGHVTISRV